MKVSGGENTFLYDLMNRQKFDEAEVSKEKTFSFGKDGFTIGSKITIDAGRGDDEIHVKKAGPDAYEVSVNGQIFTLTAEEMQNLEIKGGRGNDKIVIDPSVDIPVTVDGGRGDDQITINDGDHVVGAGSSFFEQFFAFMHGDDDVTVNGQQERMAKEE